MKGLDVTTKCCHLAHDVCGFPLLSIINFAGVQLMLVNGDKSTDLQYLHGHFFFSCTVSGPLKNSLMSHERSFMVMERVSTSCSGSDSVPDTVGWVLQGFLLKDLATNASLLVIADSEINCNDTHLPVGTVSQWIQHHHPQWHLQQRHLGAFF